MIQIFNSSQSQDILNVKVHGSKYIANRLLFICCLAEGESLLKNVPFNRDIEVSIEALKILGAEIIKHGNDLKINGSLLKKNREKKEPIKIYTHDSGTFSRFILPLLCLLGQDFYVYGSERMNERPMHDLIDCLKKMGVEIKCDKEGFLPLSLNGKNFSGGKVSMKGNVSSQYFSALLLIACYVDFGIDLKIEDHLISKKYLDMTIDLIEQFGVKVKRQEYNRFMISSDQKYQGKKYFIEADPVASSYFMAMAILKNQQVSIDNYNPNSFQGEGKFLQLINKLFEVDFEMKGEQLFLNPKKSIEDLRGMNFGTVDMGDMPDVVQTLSVIVAAIEDSKIEIINIEHLKYKESDRISDTALELRKFGVRVEEFLDHLKIIGGLEEKEDVIINCHNDHRMAMSLALLSIPIGKVTFEGEECVSKSFPDYWQKLKELNFEIKTL